MLLPAELADAAPVLPDEPPRLIPPPPPPLPPPKPPEPLVPPKPPPPLEPPKLALLDIPPIPPIPPPPLIPPKPELPPLELKLARPSDPLPVVGDSVLGPPPPLSRLLSTWTISSGGAITIRQLVRSSGMTL